MTMRLCIVLIVTVCCLGNNDVDDKQVASAIRRLLVDDLESNGVCKLIKKVGGKQYPKRVCFDDFTEQNCAVVAIGGRKLSHMKFDFHMVRKHGCRVASFDPFVTFTDKRHMELSKNLDFWKVGLSSENRIVNDKEMATLSHILEISNMTNNKIDVLKVDCEGCEWSAFHQIYEQQSDVLSKVERLALELHFEDPLFNKSQLVSFFKLLDRHNFCPFYREYHPCAQKWQLCSPPNVFFSKYFTNESVMVHPTNKMVRSWFEVAWVKNDNCNYRHWID